MMPKPMPILKRYHAEAPIKAILFDFGNVVCRFDNARFLEGLSALCGMDLPEAGFIRIYTDIFTPIDATST